MRDVLFLSSVFKINLVFEVFVEGFGCSSGFFVVVGELWQGGGIVIPMGPPSKATNRMADSLFHGWTI